MMSRLAGFLLGLVVTLLASWQLLRPEATLAPDPPVTPEATGETTAPATLGAEEPSEPAGAPEDAAPESGDAATPSPVTADALPPPDPAPPSQTLAGADAAPAPPPAPSAERPQEALEGDDPPRAHPVWTPFRSEAAARGFAEQMHSATGVQLAVVAQGPHRYQAVLGYRDEGELRSALLRMEGITGLDLGTDHE